MLAVFADVARVRVAEPHDAEVGLSRHGRRHGQIAPHRLASLDVIKVDPVVNAARAKAAESADQGKLVVAVLEEQQAGPLDVLGGLEQQACLEGVVACRSVLQEEILATVLGRDAHETRTFREAPVSCVFVHPEPATVKGWLCEVVGPFRYWCAGFGGCLKVWAA